MCLMGICVWIDKYLRVNRTYKNYLQTTGTVLYTCISKCSIFTAIEWILLCIQRWLNFSGNLTYIFFSHSSRWQFVYFFHLCNSAISSVVSWRTESKTDHNLPLFRISFQFLHPFWCVCIINIHTNSKIFAFITLVRKLR